MLEYDQLILLLDPIIVTPSDRGPRMPVGLGPATGDLAALDPVFDEVCGVTEHAAHLRQPVRVVRAARRAFPG